MVPPLQEMGPPLQEMGSPYRKWALPYKKWALPYSLERDTALPTDVGPGGPTLDSWPKEL